MQPDLLERARSAVTVGEECDVIADVIDEMRTGHPDLNALHGAVERVRVGDCPRPVLLGVVAALVPEGWRYKADSDGAAIVRTPSNVYACPVPFAPASAALRLLVAIREASHAHHQ
ncbi:MAG: hypothetical protein ACLGJC_13450 [Alphaproteobacteria bacterium]